MSDSGKAMRAAVGRAGLALSVLTGGLLASGTGSDAAMAASLQAQRNPDAHGLVGGLQLAQAEQTDPLSVPQVPTVPLPSATSPSLNGTETPGLNGVTSEPGAAAQAAPLDGAGSAAKPSLRDLNSAASNLNEALAGARAKLNELRQATELAAMAAELRDQLEVSIQENNRLAAALAEAKSEKDKLERNRSDSDGRITDLTKRVEASQLEIANLSQELTDTREQVEGINAARAQAEAHALELEGSLKTANGDMDGLRKQIADLTGKLELTESELSETNDESTRAKEEREAADRELNKVRMQIAGMLRTVLLGGEPIDVAAINSEAEPVPEPVSAEQAAGDLEAADGRYETLRASNIRAQPSADAERVGFAKRGEVVSVTGKVNGRNWYQVETAEGVRGFIFGDLLRPGA